MSPLQDPRLERFRTYLQGEPRRLFRVAALPAEQALVQRLYQRGIDSLQAQEVPLLVGIVERALNPR